jgi:hypothetical protein
MDRKYKIFDGLYFAAFAAILLLSANLFFDIMPLPDYLLSLMLVTGSLRFVIRALVQRKTRNKNISTHKSPPLNSSKLKI